MNDQVQPIRRYHKLDGWRGYWIPATAVIGSSDTGMWDDSPCPSTEVLKEIRRFQREVLRPAGIKSRSEFGSTTNAFCGKRWVKVPKQDWARAYELTKKWLAENEASLRFLHNAE